MGILGQAVAWCAIVALILNVLNSFRDRQDASRSRDKAHKDEVNAAYEHGRTSRNDEVMELRRDRDYWRNKWIEHVNGKDRKED